VDNSQAYSLKATSNPSLVDDINRLSPQAKEGHFDEYAENLSLSCLNGKLFLNPLALLV